MKGLNDLRRVRHDPNIILASATANFLGMALPLTMIQIYDRIIPSAGYETLTVLGIGVVSAILAEAAVRLARGALLSRAGAKFELKVYDQAINALTQYNHTSISSCSAGELSNRLRSIDKVRSHYCSEAAAGLLDIPFIAIFLIMMLAISPQLAATISTFLIFVFFAVRFMRNKNLKLSIAREEADTRRQSFIVQSLFGIEFIKSLGIEQLMERRYERLMSGSAPIGAQLSTQVQLNQGLTSVIGLLAPILTTSVGAYLVIAGSMSVGSLAASVLLTGRIVQPVLRIEAFLGGQNAIQHSENDLVSIVSPPISDDTPANSLIDLRTIEVSNLSWQPDASVRPVLSNIHLSLSRGDCVSISGGEGSGKSSFLSILSGQISPSDGVITLNGRDMKEYRQSEICNTFSTLTRDNRLLDGTLKENLTGFKGDEYLPRALEIASALGIDKFIEKHSSGLGMRVFSGGKSGLPNAIEDSVVMIGGLANNPDVILFDDANSRLDAEQDVRLLQYLSELQPNVIIVMITHRPSYLRLAKRHFELVKGELSEIRGSTPLDLARYGEKCA